MGLRIHSIVSVPERGEMLVKIDDVPQHMHFRVGASFRGTDGRGCWRVASIALMGPLPGHFEVEFVPVVPGFELRDGMELEPAGEQEVA